MPRGTHTYISAPLAGTWWVGKICPGQDMPTPTLYLERAGKICLDIINDDAKGKWRAALTIKQVLLAVQVACKLMRPSQQPYVSQLATLCVPACNPMCPSLQPYVSQVLLDDVNNADPAQESNARQ